MKVLPSGAWVLSACLGLAACGGGQEAVVGTDKASTASEAPGDNSAATLAAAPSAAVTVAQNRAWAASAAVNRREVQQSFDASAVGVDVQSVPANGTATTKAFSVQPAPIYRFLNSKSGAHLYTRSVNERGTILNTLPQFRYEGVVYSAWQSSEAGLSPVYRFVNVNTGVHFYTISESEKNLIQATVPTLRLEGPAFFGSKTQAAGTVPLFRFFNLQGGFHFYTANVGERDQIIASLASVFRYEGAAYYVNQTVGTFDRALASFAGKANARGDNNAAGEDARFQDIRSLAFSPAGDLYVTDLAPNSYLGISYARKIFPSGLVTDFVGSRSFGSRDGVGSGAGFYYMESITFDSAGTAYVVDSRTVRKVTPTGAVSTIAGSLSLGGYVNGQNQNARFNGIVGVAVDTLGNIYVSDSNNHAIRKITPTGVVSTFAGGDPSQRGRGNADGLGSAARFSDPRQLAIDASNNLYVADYGNHNIRKITPAGLVTTIAGQGSAGVVDGLGTSAKFDNPYAIAVDKATGNVYTADYDGYTVRRITPAGVVSTVVGTAYQEGVFFGSLPAGLSSVGGLAVRGNRLYIASLHGVYWTNLPP